MLIITSDNFSQYYREHIQTVYRIALGIIRIPEEAEDIAADCFTTTKISRSATSRRRSG